MLAYAYPFQEQLNKTHQEYINTNPDKINFVQIDSYHRFTVNLKEDAWTRIEKVSLDKDKNILGFLSASISRPDNYVFSLGIVRYIDTMSYTFSKDLHRFLKDLFEYYNMHKITFSVVVGNPIEKMYDRIIQKYCGRVVGYNKDHSMLIDGKRYDNKIYEILKSEYEVSK
jgi:hypothetical protein